MGAGSLNRIEVACRGVRRGSAGSSVDGEDAVSLEVSL